MNVSAVVAGSLGPQGLVSEGGMKASVPFTTVVVDVGTPRRVTYDFTWT